MKIRITNTNEIVDVDISICNSIDDIIRIISQSTNYEKKGISLICSGKLLNPSMLLADLNINESSKIFCVVKKNIVKSSPQQSSSPSVSQSKPIGTSNPVPQNKPAAVPARVEQRNIMNNKITPIQPLSKVNKADEQSDEEYAKQQFESPMFQKLLFECTVFPIKAELVLNFIKERDQRLWRIVSENPDLFVDAIMKMSEKKDASPSQNRVTVQLSPADQDNLQMLMSMGYSSDACIEAYLLCDKNVELAANYLLENSLVICYTK